LFANINSNTNGINIVVSCFNITTDFQKVTFSSILYTHRCLIYLPTYLLSFSLFLMDMKKLSVRPIRWWQVFLILPLIILIHHIMSCSNYNKKHLTFTNILLLSYYIHCPQYLRSVYYCIVFILYLYIHLNKQLL